MVNLDGWTSLRFWCMTAHALINLLLSLFVWLLKLSVLTGLFFT